VTGLASAFGEAFGLGEPVSIAMEWTLPLRLDMTANKREHWAAKHRRMAPQRHAAHMATVQHAGPSWGRTTWIAAQQPKPRWVKARVVGGRLKPAHWTRPRGVPAHIRIEPYGERHPLLHVTLTRIGPRRVDPDNLANAFKAVQDGVAMAFGIDDGDETAVRWDYAQERGSYGVRVRIERRVG